MRKLLTALLLLLSTASWGQDWEWAPVGAKWVYHYDIANFYNAELGYEIIESVGDTIINGKNCKILVKDRITNFFSYHDTIITYIDSNIVYYFTPFLGVVRVLYNFNLVSGDTMTVYNEADGLFGEKELLTIDSVGTTIINNDTLKYWIVSFPQGSRWSYDGYTGYNIRKIVEKIGSLGFMFPQHFNIADISYAGPLRCYEDSVLGAYETGTAPDCYYEITPSVNDIHKAHKNIKLYPIPFKEMLYIETTEKIAVDIYNVYGELVQVATGKEIDFAPYHKGVYFVVIKTATTTFYKRVVKI